MWHEGFSSHGPIDALQASRFLGDMPKEILGMLLDFDTK